MLVNSQKSVLIFKICYRNGLSARPSVSICLLSLCLSICVPVSFCLSVHMSVCLSVYMAVCLCLSNRLYVCLTACVCLSVFLSIYLSVYRYVCLTVCPSVCLSIYLSVYKYVCLTVCPSVCLCLSDCLSTYMYVCLSACVCLSVHPPLRPSVCLSVFLSFVLWWFQSAPCYRISIISTLSSTVTFRVSVQPVHNVYRKTQSFSSNRKILKYFQKYIKT